MAILPHVGRETTVTTAIGGEVQTWTLSRWDLSVWDAFLAWAKTVLPDPMVSIENSVKRLAAEERVLRKRLETDPSNEDLKGQIQDLQDMQLHHGKLGVDKAGCYLAVNSPEVESLLWSHRGTARLLWLLLQKHHQGVTEDDALLIMENVDGKALKDAYQICRGKMPPPVTPKNGQSLAPLPGCQIRQNQPAIFGGELQGGLSSVELYAGPAKS